MSVVMLFIPRYTYSHGTPGIFTCSLSFLFNSVLLSTITFDSWFAVLFWIISGVVLVVQSVVKCDVWCCLCLDYPRQPGGQPTVLIEESLIPNGSARHTTATTTIRLKNPPIGSSVINHVQSRR
jgi:hypothetical protein